MYIKIDKPVFKPYTYKLFLLNIDNKQLAWHNLSERRDADDYVKTLVMHKRKLQYLNHAHITKIWNSVT
jgi:hypothetical protein